MIDHFDNLATAKGAGDSLDARMEAIRNARIESLEKSLTGHRKIMMLCIVLLIGIGVWNGQNVVRTGSALDETRTRIGQLTASAGQATGKAGPADVVRARQIDLLNESGDVAFRLAGAGKGTLALMTAGGKRLVEIGASADGDGYIVAHSSEGHEMVRLAATAKGGTLRVGTVSGKQGVQLLANDEGALVAVYNNEGTAICTMNPDENGNGIVGAWNKTEGGQALRGLSDDTASSTGRSSEDHGTPQS